MNDFTTVSGASDSRIWDGEVTVQTSEGPWTDGLNALVLSVAEVQLALVSVVMKSLGLA